MHPPKKDKDGFWFTLNPNNTATIGFGKITYGTLGIFPVDIEETIKFLHKIKDVYKKYYANATGTTIQGNYR